MIKKLAALATVVLLLAGCSAQGGSDDEYISDVESYVGATPGSLSTASRDALIEVAHGVCSGLDSGKTASEVESVVMKLGLDEKYAGQIVSAAITNYCPS